MQNYNTDFFDVIMFIFGVFIIMGFLGFAFLNRHHYFHEFMKERQRKKFKDKDSR